jgi:hypothetical protein
MKGDVAACVPRCVIHLHMVLAKLKGIAVPHLHVDTWDTSCVSTWPNHTQPGVSSL